MKILTSVSSPLDISREEIKAKARELLLKYVLFKKWKGYDDISLNIREFMDLIFYPEFEFSVNNRVDLGFDGGGKKKLGKTVIHENGKRVIYIDASITPKDSRYVFTLCHEIGHVILHIYFLENPQMIQLLSQEEINQMEDQANDFAVHFAMNDKYVRNRFAMHYGKDSFIYEGKGPYDVGRTKHGAVYGYQIYTIWHMIKAVADPLKHHFFGISKTSLGVKLYNLGLIQNLSDEVFDLSRIK